MDVYRKQNENNNEGSSDEGFDQNGEVNYKITLEDLKKEKKRKAPPADDKITLDDLKPKKPKPDDESTTSTSDRTSTKGERIKDVLIATGEIDICACNAFHHTCGRANKPATSKSDAAISEQKEENKKSASIERLEGAPSKQTEKPKPNPRDRPVPPPPPPADLSLDGHFLFDSPAPPVDGVPCPRCPFRAKTPKGLAKHSQVHRRELEGPYNCTVCKYQGKSRVYLARHMLLHAGDGEGDAAAPLLTCEHCPYTTRHPASMTRHRNSHEDQSELRKFRCDKCEYKAKRKDHLERHLFTHLRNDNEVLIP